MNKVVISGATGAIGIALIKECINNGVEVLVLTHKNSGRNGFLPKSSLVTLLNCDLEDLSSIGNQIEQKYDVFYHLAWNGGAKRDDVELQLKNIQYSLDAVKLAAQIGCKKFVGAGSQAEYGFTDVKLNENVPTFPQNAFGASKLYSGYMSRFLAQQNGMEHIWTRILSVYGPYDGRHTMIISSIVSMLRGEKTKFTKAEQMWDFLYSDDAGKAMFLLGKNGKNGKTYAIGSGNARPLKEYIFEMRDEINPILELGMGELPYSPTQTKYLCADINPLTEDAGFIPTTDFKEGIIKTINWVRERNRENE